MWALIPNPLKIAAGGFLCAIAGWSGGYLYGASVTRADIEAKAATEALERIQQMDKSNESFRNKSSYDRCVAVLRDSELPIDGCERFRVSDRPVQ